MHAHADAPRCAPTPPLAAGGHLRVLAPCGPLDPAFLDPGLAALRTRFAVTEGASLRARAGYLAGSDDARAGDLDAALHDPSVRAIVAGRGGFGATRLLEVHAARWIPVLRRDPKAIAGFSDVTALHALWTRAGVRSVHGTMAAAMGRDGLDAELCDVLGGGVPAPWTGLEALHSGALPGVTGVALGGNLSLVMALLATPLALDLAGAVLFLEEVSEAPYRVDRMLTALRMSGALRSVSAVVLGEFTHAGPGSDDGVMASVLRERLGDLGVPVLAGAPFGHGARHRPWVQGARVTVHGIGRLVHEEGLS